MNLVSVAHIYSRLPAIFSNNFTWRFWESRGATAYVLHQLGVVMDLCISMGNDFMQPKHLEQEMYGRPLHLYTSVFAGGMILC